MNASNENHNPTTSDDPSDRLIDVALTELIGGQSPPDLSSRITAAYEQTPSIKPMVTKPDRRVVWSVLAVAAVLMIGATFLLIPAVQNAREAGPIARGVRESQKQDRLGSITPDVDARKTTPPSHDHAAEVAQLPQKLQNHHEPSKSFPDASASTVTASPTKDWSRFNAVESAPINPVAPTRGPVDAIAQSPNRSSGPAGPEGAPHETVKSAPSETITWFTQPPGVALGGPGSPRGETETRQFEGPGAAPTPQLSVQSTSSSTLSDGKSARSTRTVTVSDGFDYQQNHRDDTLRAINNATVIVDEKLVSDDVLDLIKAREGTGPGASGDKYTRINENPFIKAEGGAAVSTFSIDVDTASYTNVRQFLLGQNQLPPPDAVRIEELVNYFQYNYAGPRHSDAVTNTPAAPGSAGGSNPDEAPFAAHVEITGCPWAPEHRLARIGIKGREIDRAKRPQSNLVFLIDVSGSMDEPAKLPLVINGLEQLTRELGENDKVAIVVYASSEGLVLPSTRGDKQDTILAALGKLKAGGSTAGGAGIQLAYQLAEDNFIKGGTNRVILCTDGDFNVGVTSTAELERLVEKKAKDTGVFLSVLGFGRGNLNDAMMEAISNHGNGNYHYVDNRTEARRVLVEQMTGTLITIAKDVKIQVEFNPAQVAGYRLIGYEDRMLRTEDFNNDKKDAGEIGAGHTVTALYEVVPTGKQIDVTAVDELKYQQPVGRTTRPSDDPEDGRIVHPTADQSHELLTLKMRYKAPDGDTSKKLEWPITDEGKAFSAASEDLKFATSVAGFGLMLRDSQHKGNLNYAAVLELAQSGIGEDPHGYRKEFVEMIRKAKELRHE